MTLFLSIVAFLVGGLIVGTTILTAVRTVVLPHGRSANITRLWFVAVRRLVMAAGALRRTDDRHGSLALYPPLALACLPMLWLTSALLGFTAMFWALEPDSLRTAFKRAGSGMLTIGFSDANDLPGLALTFFAAALTISLLALLLVTYLPTMYQAYSSREFMVTGLETFGGEPPDPVELLIRYSQIRADDKLPELWTAWREWFFEARDSHTALPAVVLFRSSSPERDWVPVVAALLDAAALRNAACVKGEEPEASLCIRAGTITLNDIADHFGLAWNENPVSGGAISVDRSTFDAMFDELRSAGVELQCDRDEAWRAWAGWRVNYDAALCSLLELTTASYHRHDTES